jgi:hypothetical protein
MKKFLVIFALLSLTACATVKQEPNLVITAAPPVAAPKADPLVLAPVQWHVYNSTELKKLSDSLAASGGNVVLFTLDETNFKNLSSNLVDVNKFIDQQNAIIDFLNKAANAPSKAAAAAQPPPPAPAPVKK